MRRRAGNVTQPHQALRHTLLVPIAGDTVRLLAPYLDAMGYAVTYMPDLLSGLAWLPQRGHITILMEMGTRRTATLELCRAIRRIRNVPVIVVTRPDAEEERIAALEAGADDALSPPFCAAELVARLGAVTRRYVTSTRAPGRGGSRAVRSPGSRSGP